MKQLKFRDIFQLVYENHGIAIQITYLLELLKST